MDLAAHLESYKKSFEASMLPDYRLFLKARNKNAQLDQLVQGIKASIGAKDAKLYLEWLTSHQKFMLAAFRAMLDEAFEIMPMQEGSDWLKLALTYGWNWFKLSSCKGLKLRIDSYDKQIDVVPRYSEDLRPYWGGRPVCLDADEAACLYTIHADAVKEVLRNKAQSPDCKLCGAYLVPIATYNRSSVRDWTLPLEVAV
jgi:hypothetical protein